MNYRISSKWTVLFGALLAQFAIGALYAWSLFNKPISVAWGLMAESGSGPANAVVMTYAISLVSFSLAFMASGRIQLIKGPRFTALIGATLYTTGIVLSSQVSTPAMLYVTYGMLGGAGVAFIYVCPISTLVKWFPAHKGTITGVATAAFAGGAILFKFVISHLLHADSYTPEVISNTFLTLGIIYGIMTFVGASLLDVPDQLTEVIDDGRKQHSSREMLKSANFYKLLFSDLLALMPGLLIIGLAKDIGRDYIGLEYALSASVVGIIAGFNAFGRLASGRLADKFGAITIYRLMYFMTIIALAGLSFLTLNYAGFLILVVIIGIAYGSFLSLVPTITGQLFGSKNFSANYSFVFQAYGISALLGIAIKSRVTYSQAFTIAMSTAIIGLIIAMTIQDNDTALEKKEDIPDHLIFPGTKESVV
ncbi:MAG: OFA family MFS transporter [Fibrobacterota bacterium]